MGNLETLLGITLYPSQLLCLNFLIGNLHSNNLICFGIGNGKTLLCTALAIVIAKQLQKSVFIVSKNEHLVSRDQKHFEKVVTKMGLATSFNQYS